MIFQSAQAFRRSLEARLRAVGVGSGEPLSRLRKTVAFDRLLARIAASDPSGWVLKGGFALQVRYRLASRATKDLDLLLRQTGEDAEAGLRQAARLDLSDWFEFEIGRPTALPSENAARFPVTSRLDGRVFETFHVDVGVGDPVTAPTELVAVTSLLDFADLPRTMFPSYPATQQLAEKLHAMTLPRTAPNSRVKDLVDVVLIASHERIDRQALSSAIDATFRARGTHVPPATIPAPAAAWGPAYRRLASEVGLTSTALEHGHRVAGALFEPFIEGNTASSWDPEASRWE
jgi:hypothetical protein